MESRSTRCPPQFTACIEAFDAELEYIYRTLLRHGVRGADVEDLAQDVLLVMWRRWDEFDPSRPLRPWLAGIAFKVARRHQSRSTRYTLLGAIDPPDDAPTPEQALDSARAPALVLRVLAALPERHRSTLVMHDIDGLPVDEMATLMSVPLFTAYSRIRAARKAFAAQLARSDDRNSTKMAPAMLLTMERTPPAMPREARLRILARARATPFESLPQGGPHLVGLARRTRALVGGTAVVAALGLLVWSVFWKRHPATAELAAVAPVAAPVGRTLAAAPRPRHGPDARSLSAVLPGTTWRDPTAAVDRGLVGYWRFDDQRGNTLARDLSGYERDCVPRGRNVRDAWIDGTLGGAIQLGNLRWLECTDGEPTATAPVEITVALWVKTRQPREERHWALVARRMGVSNKRYFFFGFAGQNLMVDSHAWHGKLVRPFPRTDDWVHVAFTHDAAGVTRLFIGGVEVGSERGRRGPVSGENALLTMGAYSMGESGKARAHFDGALDELLIYDRALPEAEIAALATGVQPNR